MRLDQTSALPGRTSAIAQFVSSGSPGRKWKVKRWSSVLASRLTGGGTGSSAFFRSASTLASDLPSAGPGPQSTLSARIASMHCPNVSPRTATPPATLRVCGMSATSVIPGMALTCARFLTERGVPLIVGGRQTIVGLAFGTSSSIAKRLRPVTMSSASTRFCGVPTTRNCERDLSCALTVAVSDTAAFALSSP